MSMKGLETRTVHPAVRITELIREYSKIKIVVT